MALTVVTVPLLRAQIVADSAPASAGSPSMLPGPSVSAAPAFRNTVALMGGGFIYGLGGDGTFPYMSVRVGRDINSYAVVEGSVGYANTREQILIFGNTIDAVNPSTPFRAADVSLYFQLPVWRLAPYFGTGAGVYSVSGARTAYQSTTIVFRGHSGFSLSLMTGLKVRATRRIGIRGELRLRADQMQSDLTGNVEEAVGLFVRY